MHGQSAPGRQTLSIPEFAKIIGISSRLAYEGAGRDFHAIKIGARIVVPVSEVERLLHPDTASTSTTR